MELMAASDGTTLTGSATQIRVPLENRSHVLMQSALAHPDRETITLDVEGMQAEANPGVVYQVFLNAHSGQDLSGDEAYDNHFVGTLSFFGANHPRSISGHYDGPPGLRRTFDITDLVHRLQAEDQWDPSNIRVTFEPTGLIPPEGTQPTTPPPHPPVRIARVAVYHH